MKSFAFVIIQFSCIAYFALTGNFILFEPLYFVIQTIGALTILWAIFTMKPTQWMIFPEPKMLGNLIVSGPYRWVRHPMYSGLLIMTAAIVLYRCEWPPLLVFIGFLINQIQKLTYEESMLLERFPEYVKYKQNTKRLFPIIY